MPFDHKVKQGESIASIAKKYGFLADTLWNDSANESLKDQRKTQHILLPGDVVVIPDKKVKEEIIQTGARHTFRKKGTLEELNIQLKDEFGEPRADTLYILNVDGHLYRGNTDSDGILKQTIAVGAKSGSLVLGESYDEEIPLAFGNLDPIDTPTGILARLENLGVACDPLISGEAFSVSEALQKFQHMHGLDASGDLDDDTQKKLEEQYGC